MMEVTLTEIDGLRRALADHATKNCLRIFLIDQANAHMKILVDEMKKSSPDVMQAAQEAGRVDVYEHLLSELEYFVKPKV